MEIELVNLDKNATLKDMEKLCNDAIKNHYNVVKIYPYYIPLVKGLLEGTNCDICTVIGYEHGNTTLTVKSYEAIEYINSGADIIELTLNSTAIKNEDYEYIKEEIEEIRDSIDGKALKVDATDLNDDELKEVIKICNETFINYIKINVEQLRLTKSLKSEVLEINLIGNIDIEDDIRLLSLKEE